MKGSTGHERHRGRHDILAGKHQGDKRLAIDVGEYLDSDML